MLQLTGADRDTPIWAIDHRSPLHVAIDAALMQGEIPHDPHANTLLYGIADTALNVAMTAWVEEMNQRSLPGLLLIDTEARSLEESSVWGSVDALGLVELMNGFRCLDTRLNHLPGRIYANAVVWRQAINSVTFDDANFRQSGTMAVIEQAIRERAFLGINSELAPVSSSGFLEACSLAADPGVLVENLLDEIERKAPDRHVFRDYARKYLGLVSGRESPDRCPKGSPLELPARLQRAIDGLRRRQFADRINLHKEGQYRPMIVLFSRNDPTSVLLAGALHGTFAAFSPNAEEAFRRGLPRPIVYVNEQAADFSPYFLCFDGFTYIVETQASSYPSAVKYLFKISTLVECETTGIRVNGRFLKASV
ncbi:hypothetical protein [Elstera sp.]|jgi:hypothetical protein|uniref:hypothetical protein n=1 Tax=Elstera sp. TaxID=1916664 RepID=UPI0037BE8807